MTVSRKAWSLRRIQHPLFIAFLLLLVLCVAALSMSLDIAEAFLAGFDASASVFIAATALLLGRDSPDHLRERAARNDAGRALLLVMAVLLLLVVLLAVGIELGRTGQPRGTEVLIVVLTLAIAWLFANFVYALHYAHLFYDPGPGGGDHSGLVFAGTATPDFWDFCYFALVLGMTFQVSDVQIASRRIRRTAALHALAAFFFNIGVVALTVNVVAGAV